MRKILIVGGVAGGATVAARLRRLSEEDEIIIFEKDQYISFSNCGLPYYIGGVVKDRNDLLVETPEKMKKNYNVDVRIFSEVTSIDKKSKVVTVQKTQSGERYQENYDILILSPGAKPIRPRIPGIEGAKAVYTLRNVEDTDRIMAAIEHIKPRKAVVVGGGFIGVEMAENLTHRGIEVALAEKMPQVLKPLDYEMAQIVHQELAENGVKLYLGDGVERFEGDNIVLESDTILESELTILAMGVSPQSGIAKDAGLAVNDRGYIVTSKTYETYDVTTGEMEKDIFAIGDAIEVTNFVDGEKATIALAGPANRQGRTLADHINGLSFKADGFQGSSVAKIFSKTAASTGLNSAQLREKGLPFMEVHAQRSNHVAYMPGAAPIVLKLLFDPESKKIYGAQGVGGSGTDKRIDVIATVMRLRGTAMDLSSLELCYAPPYSGAKDPVNILGYIVENTVNSPLKYVQWYDVDKIINGGGFLLDVRTKEEYEKGHIKGSINLPLDEIRDNTDKLPQDKNAPLYITCQVGQRGYVAARILIGEGYTNLYNLSGGYGVYRMGKAKNC